MKKQITTIIMGIFLLASVSALYGGESTIITFDFEPVACSVDDALDYNINVKDVSIDIPINFQGNFTLTCFSGEEADPVIVYRGGGGRTKYIDNNVTQYVNRTVEVERIVEVEVPGKTIIEEKIIEVKSGFGTKGKIIVGCLLAVISFLLIWNTVVNSKKVDIINNDNYKGGENKNE